MDLSFDAISALPISGEPFKTELRRVRTFMALAEDRRFRVPGETRRVTITGETRRLVA